MPDRTVAPPFVKSSSFNLIKPREKTLPNGVDLHFVSGGSQEVLKIELIFPAGRWFEDKPAASYFTAHMLAKGTTTKSSFEIAGIFDRYGAHLDVNPGLDFVSISVYTLTRKLIPVLDLLKEIITAPVFPDKDFRQLQSAFIQSLNINNEKTSYVASQAFRKILFGEQHPYGVDISVEHVNALQPPALRKYFIDYLHSPLVFISGKVDSNSADLILKTFAGLPTAQARRPVQHIVATEPADQHLEKKDSVQSSVRLGKRSLLRIDPDYVSLLFATHILGGYFGSRLMKNIREDKGLTYGISASVHGLKNDSYLVIGADVNKENINLTFDEIRKELKTLRTILISSDELETTRNHFIGSLQAEITTSFAHAEKLKTIALFNLPPDYYQTMISRIEMITPEDVAAISEQHLHEDSFFQVAVG